MIALSVWMYDSLFLSPNMMSMSINTIINPTFRIVHVTDKFQLRYLEVHFLGSLFWDSSGFVFDSTAPFSTSNIFNSLCEYLLC